ncbi:MAG TPA: hypothetical protein VJ805_02940 [Nitrospiraceae bacterium]|nr:hypothetical protein [Nitrospiraceae bacterium]
MALIQLDLVLGSGDQLLTFDDETNLDWLNLTATANKSYDDVMAGFGGFIGPYGFAYGDASQVGTLLVHAGITKGISEPIFQPSPNDMLNHVGIQMIQSLMNGRFFIAGTPHSKVQTRGIIKPPVPSPDPNASLNAFITSLNLIVPVNSHVDILPSTRPGLRMPNLSSYLCRLHG